MNMMLNQKSRSKYADIGQFAHDAYLTYDDVSIQRILIPLYICLDWFRTRYLFFVEPEVEN